VGALLAFELTPSQRGACLATLCFAALAHSSNPLVIVAVPGACLAMSLGTQQAAAPVLRSGALVLGAVCVGLAGELATNAVVQRSTGQAPIRPPFLMARLITDGPGADWARAHCASSPYVVCRYAANFGQGSSDDFLWDHDPRIGVFSVASRDERVALAQEQLAFARDVVAAYPWRVAADAARNFGRQLTLTGISQFTYGPAEVDYFAHKIPATDFAHLKDTLAAARRFPNTRLASVQALVSVLSVAVLVGWAWRRWRTAPRRWRVFAGLVVLGVLTNALVCGALSTPYDRYQARVVWLLPLLAFMVSFAGAVRAAVPARGRVRARAAGAAVGVGAGAGAGALRREPR